MKCSEIVKCNSKSIVGKYVWGDNATAVVTTVGAFSIKNSKAHSILIGAYVSDGVIFNFHLYDISNSEPFLPFLSTNKLCDTGEHVNQVNQVNQ